MEFGLNEKKPLSLRLNVGHQNNTVIVTRGVASKLELIHVSTILKICAISIAPTFCLLSFRLVCSII